MSISRSLDLASTPAAPSGDVTGAVLSVPWTGSAADTTSKHSAMPGPYNEVQVRLQRDSLTTPWGFRLQGGKDFKAPLTVQRVSTPVLCATPWP